VTHPRREWMQTFADEAVMSDLYAAVRELMAQVCDHAPEDCNCPLNRVTPIEVAEWIEMEVRQNREGPIRFEPGNRPRRKESSTLNLAVSG